METKEITIDKIDYKIEISFSSSSISLFEFMMNRIEENNYKEREKEDVTINNFT